MSEEDTQRSGEDDELAGKNGEDAGDEQGEDDEQASKFSARKIILYVVAPLFILGGIAGGLYVSGALDSMLASDKETQDKKEKDKDKKDKKKAVFLKIPDILVNLKAQSGQPRYLRLKVKLELKSQKDMETVKTVMPRIVDQFQTFLRELRVKDLRGSAGIYRLQKELLARVNAAAPDAEVKDVLFQEMLIQ